MLKAVLFESPRRFEAFRKKLEEAGVDCVCASFEGSRWLDLDYETVDVVIYYPSFFFSSNHPLALSRVKDDLYHIHLMNPAIRMYPDPALIRYYNDKYRQLLYLRSRNYPVPDSMALVSDRDVERAQREFGFPLVVKNRFGAGGESVFIVADERDLRAKYEISRLDLWSGTGLKYILGQLANRAFYYHLIRERRARYPLLSWPLIAQRFVEMDRDLKTVVRDGRIVEGHWRVRVDSSMWKTNIDGGGIGEWSHIPREAIELSEKLARDLGVRWINLDLIPFEERFLISEFSPVWHHYRYREKPNFVYRDDYNVPVPLERALDLEGLIVESLLEDARPGRAGR